MKIYHGLLPGQVLQRNRKGRGAARLSGSSGRNGTVEARIRKGEKVLRGHDWKVVGAAEKRKFVAELANIPSGGPYRVELRVSDSGKAMETLTVDEVFVGDVWIMAGQSNMQGCGNIVDAPKPHPLVRAFYTRDEWGIAEEPIHFLEEAVDLFHNPWGTGPDRPPRRELVKWRKSCKKGVSPGHFFALDMLKRTRVPQGLIACAHGGTSMAQWSPALRDQGGASLYGAMMRRFEKLGQPIAGILWYQGESDTDETAAKVYTEKMIELVESTRRDMGNRRLPWLVVQLGCHIAPDGEYWNSIQDQQRRLPERIDHLDVAPAVDLVLDDGIHIGGVGQRVLGKRLARIADRLVNKNTRAKGSLTIKKIDVSFKAPYAGDPDTCVIEVTYNNVVGKLESQGRPDGFTLVNDAGENIRGVYKTRLRGNTVVLESDHGLEGTRKARLSYGHGRHSYCNITDSDGMSLPALKGVPLG